MPTDPLSVTFRALADPTRRAMMARLARGEASMLELARPFKISQPAISKHVKVLEKSGLIVRRSLAQQRFCKLRSKPIEDAMDWMETQRRLLEGQMDKFEAYLKEIQKKGKKHADS